MTMKCFMRFGILLCVGEVRCGSIFISESSMVRPLDEYFEGSAKRNPQFEHQVRLHSLSEIGGEISGTADMKYHRLEPKGLTLGSMTYRTL